MEEQDPTPPSPKKNSTLYNKTSSDHNPDDDNDDDDDGDEDEMKDIKIPMNNGRLLDLTRMLDQKKKA